MERPKIVVVEQRDFPNRDIYEEEIETYRGAGYRVAFSKGSSDEKGYTVLEEKEGQNGET